MTEKKDQVIDTMAPESLKKFSPSSNEIQGTDSSTCPGEFAGRNELSQLDDSVVISKEECAMSNFDSPSNSTKKRGRLSQAEISEEQRKLFDLLDNDLDYLEAITRLGIPEKRIAKHLLAYQFSKNSSHRTCLCEDLVTVITGLPDKGYTEKSVFKVEDSDEKITLTVILPDE
jgi:hypothetical protein